MADKVRRKASNIVVWVILALLIVGLAGFGVGNFGGNVRSVGAVGQTEIPVDAYARALQQQLRGFQQRTGQPLSFAEARTFGLDAVVQQELLTSAAIDEAARLAGLSVGDAAVGAQILEIPAFRGADGGFNAGAYRGALDNAGLSVADFEDGIRAELARTLFSGAIAAGVAPPTAYAAAIWTYLAERRGVSFAEVTEALLEAPVAAPSGAEVQAFYDETPAPFTLPERRRLTYAWVTPEMLAGEVALEEAALRTEYGRRLNEFVRPERRIVDRLVMPDAAAAEAARAAIEAGGASFDDLVAERGLTAADVALDDVSEAELGEAGAGIFALEEPGVAGPLPSPLGPALYRVGAILAPQATSFEQALPELREALGRTEAEAAIAGEIDRLDDLLAGGATLEDLARESDLRLETMNWTGAETGGIAAYPAFAAAAARIGTDDFPEITVLPDGGIFALRLDAIVPAEVQPLDDVREEAATLAAEAKRQAALVAAAEARIAEMAEDAGLTDAGFAEATEAVLTRTDIGNVPGEVATRAFELAPGETAIVAAEGRVLVLRLDAIQPPDAEDPRATPLQQSLSLQAAEGMARDLVNEFAAAIQAREGISLNAAALNAVHAQLP